MQAFTHKSTLFSYMLQIVKKARIELPMGLKRKFSVKNSSFLSEKK